MPKLLLYGRGTNQGWANPLKSYDVTDQMGSDAISGAMRFVRVDGGEVFTNMDFILEKDPEDDGHKRIN